MNTPTVSPITVGRAEPLGQLGQILAQTRSGSGQTVLLAGEAGIGKSRLVAEARRLAASSGMEVLEGHCFEQDHALPYAPLVDLLHACLRCQGTARLDEIVAPALSPASATLVRLLPGLAAFLPNRTSAPVLPPGEERRHLFAALTQFVTRLASDRPLLLVVEDLHWSDQASLEFLLHLARRVSASPLALLLTYRNDEVSTHLLHFLSLLDRERLSTEIELAPLTATETAEMARAILGPQRSLGPAWAARLHALTEGNPFFVEEMLKTVSPEAVEAGSPPSQAAIPRSVRDAVQQRSAQLSPPAQHALVMAAVAGRWFDFELLQDLTGMDEPTLLAQLKQLVAAQLIVEESADRYAFRHALTREAVYATLLRRERQRIHHAIAQSLERLAEHGQTPDMQLADLAYHYFQAEAWQPALEYSLRAGERAQALYAPREAVEHLSRAMDAARHLDQPVPLSLWRTRGQAYETLGDFERARADFDGVLGQARRANDRHAEWQALLDLGKLWASRNYARTGEYRRQALALARQMDDARTLAYSLNWFGNWHINVEQPAEGQRLHEEALTIFQELGDVAGQAATHDLLGMAGYLGADLIQGTAHYQQAVTLFRQLDDRSGLASSLATLAMRGPTYQTNSMVSAGTLPEAVHEAQAALMVAREIGWRTTEAYAQLTLGWALGAMGEYGQALQAAQASLAIAEETEHRQWTTAARCVLGSIYLDLLDPVRARDLLEPARALAVEVGSWHWLRQTAAFLASALILLNDLGRARELLDSALEADHPPQTLAQRLVWCTRAELALAQGDGERALAIVDRLINSAVNLTEGRINARLGKLRGDALATVARAVPHRQAKRLQAEAETTLVTAQAAAEADGARPLAWRILVRLGKLRQAQARRRQAEQAFSAARAVIDELAATLPDPDLRGRFVQSATATLPRLRADSATRAAFGGLTRRERQVAVLIADGKSNREIAVALVVGERTVETHVANILSKLGLTSRREIAAWAAERGLPKTPET